MKFDHRPFFLETTPFERCCMCLSVGANLAVMAFCAAYLFLEFGASGITWPAALFWFGPGCNDD